MLPNVYHSTLFNEIDSFPRCEAPYAEPYVVSQNQGPASILTVPRRAKINPQDVTLWSTIYSYLLGIDLGTIYS